MRSNTKVIRNKLSLLNLAQELKNVLQTCKILGYSRGGTAEGEKSALLEKSRRKPNLKNRIDDVTEANIVQMAFDFPVYGQLKASNELRKREIFISPTC